MTLQADIVPLVFLLVIVASVLNTIYRSIKEKGNQADAPTDVARPASGTSEEERMRKFLEALGVPTDAAPPVVVQRPTSPPPPPVVVSSPPPMSPPPTLAPQPTGRRFPRPFFDPQQGFPKGGMTRLPPERKPEAMEDFPGFPRKAMVPLPPVADFPSEPEPITVRTGSPTLIAPNAPPVDAATSQLADRFEAITNSSSTEQSTREIAATNGPSPAQWAALLRDRNELRKAILLREIFGPPRSLQSTL